MSGSPIDPAKGSGRGGYHTPRTPVELRDAHKAKMVRKAKRRAEMHVAMNNPKRLARLRVANGTSIATGNRWGGPHKHAREIARRTGRTQ